MPGLEVCIVILRISVYQMDLLVGSQKTCNDNVTLQVPLVFSLSGHDCCVHDCVSYNSILDVNQWAFTVIQECSVIIFFD